MRLLTEAQVSEMLQVPAKTLRRWRMINRGPRFVKLGGRLGSRSGTVRYPEAELLAWLNSRPTGGESPNDNDREVA